MRRWKDPLKPWEARRASGSCRVDWVVAGGCPVPRERCCGDWDWECSSECGCNCAHCDGEGTHLIAMDLTEEEARKVAEMGSITEVEQFLLTLGDRFIYYPPTVEEACRHGVRRRVIANPNSTTALAVFPEYARYRESSA